MRRPYVVSLLSFVFILCVNSGLQAQVAGAAAGQTQVAGENVNMVSGTVWPAGDQFLQRQNEPSMAVSSRNPEHLLAGANDYRTVDIAKPGATDYRGDAWLGVFTTIDGGDSWKSTPLPGYPQDTSHIGQMSPLHNIYNVATDPTVRAGTDGIIYYSGLAFNRGSNSGSAVFVSTFQDLNNKGNGNGPFEQTPNGTGSPFLYLNTVIVDTTSNQFVDKPWIAVDVPRPGRTATCTMNGKTFSSGYVYLFYTFFNGSNKNPTARINVAISTNCGASWSKPQTISQSSQLNQGTVAAVDPGTGTVYVSWRQEGNGTQNQPDQILYGSSSDGGSTWTTQTVYTFPNPTATVGAFDLDENTTGTQFRGEDIPSLAVDSFGRVWVAFSQRVCITMSTSPCTSTNGLPGSRIYVTTLPRGGGSHSWTTPYRLDASAPISGPAAIYGHQLMPSLTYAFGRIMAIWLDTRWDNQQQVLNCNRNTPPTCTITHSPIQNSFLSAGRPDLVFTPNITDPIGGGIRHTVDVFGSMLMPSSTFNSPTVQALQISQYKFYFNTTDNQFEQGNFNPPNLPMFVQGTQPFIGDYLDVAAQTIVPSGNTWTFNTDSSNAPVFHATWTDNRDVVPPPILAGPPQTQNWTQYSPPGASSSSPSIFNPSAMESDCQTGYSGDRNQNVYTARFTAGLVVRFKENAKPLTKQTGGSVQRSFSLYVRNTVSALVNPDPALYRILIGTTSTSQACSTMIAGGTANFAGDSCQLDVAIPPRTTISRAIVVNSKNANDTVNVLVAAIDANGNFVSGGLQATAALNNFPNNPGVIVDPDQIAFDPTDPDSTSPSNNSQIQLVNGEFYDPTTAGSLLQGESSPSISSPSISSPSIVGSANASPSIASPSIASPSIVSIASPSITAVQTASPSIVTIPNSSPSIASPSIASPSIVNLENSSPSIATPGDTATDYSFTITNKGDTAASYNAKEFVKQMGGSGACSNGNCQLIIHRTHGSPTAAIDQNTGQATCSLAVQVQDLTQANIPNPAFSTSGSTSTDNSSSANNATVTLGPGEGTRVTLRVFGKTINNPTTAFPIKAVAVGTVPDTGQTTNPASLTITSTEVPVALVGNPYTTQLTSIGGVAPTSWFPFNDMPEAGSQPLGVPGFSLSPSGVISADTGIVTSSPSNNSVNVEVQDSATPVNTDLQTLSLEVNKFSASISAANSFTTPGSIYISANPGDKVTVSMMVHNDGPATATNVFAASMLLQTTQIAGGGPTPSLRCSLPQPAGPVTIPGGQVQEFDYTCDMPTGNGVVTFTSSAAADYCPISGVLRDGITCVNPALKVSANTGSLISNQITVDTTPPTLNFGAVTPTPNAAGWNSTTPVTINYMTSDNLSGVASSNPSAPVAFTNQGPNQNTVVTVLDNAGNKATFTTPAVSIDTIAPVITAVASPAPNAAGWNNTPVTVTFNCVDNVVGIASGVATVTSPITLSNDGKNQSSSGTCTDVAGNSANTTASGINIDRTIPPVAIAAPTAGQIFVLNSTITPMYTCGDGSVDNVTCTVSPSPTPYVATPVGGGSFTVSALDQAGNANQASTNYLVVYNFMGFQAPLQPAGPPNAPSNSGAFTLGNAIPVQLQLQDANGSFITDPSALTSVVAYPNSACTGAPDGSAIPLYQNGSAVAPSTFAVSANVYTLTWNTTGVAAACYNIVVTLKDTTQHTTIVNLVTSGTATQFADGVFNNANWSSAKVFDSTPLSGAAFTATQVGSGGNPNEYRQVNMTFGQGSIVVGHLNPLSVYTPATQGAIGSISYSYDVREFNPPFVGAALNYALLLLQNGTYYVPDPTDTFSNTNNWMNVGNTNLTATQFSNLYQGAFQLTGAGPLHPDFSAGGAPITFGYFSANTNTGAAPITTSSGIDNWSVNVSPFMNVSGSEITGFYAANGAFSSAPNDLSTTPVSAFVPNGMGGFNSIAGAGKADGTLSILNVPAGFYWLQLGNQWLWTSEAIIDAGSTSEGRASAVHANTTVNFAVSGMSPWQPGDSLEYWTPNVYEVDSDIGTSPAAGATSYNDTVPLQGLIDTSQGDVFYLMHLGGSISGNYTIDAMEDVFSPAGPIMETPGSVNNFSGSFTQLAQNSTVRLAVNASQFAQFAAAAGPGATLNTSTFGVHVTTPSQELLFGNADPALFEFFRTDFGGISSDFDLGDEHYGDPFPAAYVRYYAYEQDFSVPFMSPGATLPGSSFVGTQAITLTPPSSMAPLAPVVGPVSSVALNGTPFTQAMSGVGTTPTISWQAPTVGSATNYRVGIFQLGVNANGRSTRTRVATLSSTATNIQIPPGILMTGASYLLEIVAVHRAGFDGQANLFKTKFPYGISQIVTYQLAP